MALFSVGSMHFPIAIMAMAWALLAQPVAAPRGTNEQQWPTNCSAPCWLQQTTAQLANGFDSGFQGCEADETVLACWMHPRQVATVAFPHATCVTARCVSSSLPSINFACLNA